jgi:hypothetical protein
MGQGQPPAEASADAEVPAVVEGEADPTPDRAEPAAAEAEPAASIEVPPAADLPEADAPTSEEPATVADPATDSPPVVDAVPTDEHEVEAPEFDPTVEMPAMEPTAPEVVPDESPAAEEYGIAPSAFYGPLSVVRCPSFTRGSRRRSAYRTPYSRRWTAAGSRRTRSSQRGRWGRSRSPYRKPDPGQNRIRSPPTSH